MFYLIAPLTTATDSNLHYIFTILYQLRLSTEVFSEAWILALNIWLLRYTQILKVIPITGMLMLLLVFAQMTAVLSDWHYALFMAYIHLKSSWFVAVGLWALKAHNKPVNATAALNVPDS